MRKTILNVLLTILAFSLVMFVACKDEPVASGAGSVTCTLNGVVYDSQTKKPVEGASVDIGIKAVTTDKNGCFAIDNVAPGSYTISIVKDGYEMATRDDVLVDSGRFYNNLSENDKAALTDLISSGAIIDDYYAELLFGGERDAEEVPHNPDINSVGDAKYYGQTVFAVGLTPSYAVLEGAINVKFADGSTYDVPEGVGIIALCLARLDELEVVRTYRTTVGENGSFRFENIQNGPYYLAVDPMSITLNGVTVEIDGHLFKDEDDGVLVVNGYGTTNTLYVPGDELEDPFKLKVVSVKAIDRSELPLSSVSRDVNPDVSMQAGQVIVIEFNKPIDEDAFGTQFFFESVHTQITGYTKHLIVNDDEHGYAYVWHDNINSADDLRLWYCVSSFEKDETLFDCIYLDYVYQLNLMETNLYGYDYNHKLEDGVFNADQPIVIVFDKEIPEDSTVEGVLSKHQGGLDPEIPVFFEYDGKVLLAYAPLEYRFNKDFYYTLKFKITTAEDVVVYNTENGLTMPELRNMLLRVDNSVKFTTAEIEVLAATGSGLDESIDPYDEFYAVFNLDLDGNIADAWLTYLPDPDHESFIPLNCEIDGKIITATLDEGKALNPDFTYKLHLEVYSELYDELFALSDGLFELESPYFNVNKYFDDLFHNGLEDFTLIGDNYDYDSTTVSFSWTSLGEFLGEHEVYDLYMRKLDKGVGEWKFVASFDELSRFEYTYRDKEIEHDCLALTAGDLLYCKCAQFVLITYDEDGLMIQSPVQVVYDMVGPEVTSQDPYIEVETPYVELHTKPVVFTLITDEAIDSVWEEDVEVGGAHPEYFDVTWVMTGENTVKFTVDALYAPMSGYYEEGDLELTITLWDTSYNLTEKVIDFKKAPQA